MLKAPIVCAFIAVTALSATSAGSQDLCNDAHMCKSRSNNPSLKRPIGLAAPEQNCGS